MRKKLLVMLALAGLTGATVAPTPAGAVTCHTLRCINLTLTSQAHKIKALKAQVATLQNKVKTLNSAVFVCEQEVPVTQYGDPNGTFGYVFDDGGAFDTTGLDVTAPGDTVDEWFIFDACNTQTTPTPPRAASGVNRGTITHMRAIRK